MTESRTVLVVDDDQNFRRVMEYQLHEDGYRVLTALSVTANADDASPTWVSIGAAPNDQYASVNYMEGDPDVPGRVWVATGCAGVQLGEFGSIAMQTRDLRKRRV